MNTTTKPNPTPAPKPDAQPVQAAIPARPKLGAPASEWADYNAAISAAGIRFQDKLDADFVAKAQPVQTAHTPGPWTAILSAGDDPWMVAAEMPVARVPDYSGNAEVNARLIAAAPALLVALEQCLPYVDRIRAMSGGDGDLTALTARAALNAAKGGAQ